MSESMFLENSDKLKARFGRSIPHNVLDYFLKENGGDIDKCVQDLEKNNWFKRRHTSDIEPTRAVDNYKRTDSHFLSSSHGSGDQFSSQFRQHYPGTHGGGGHGNIGPSSALNNSVANDQYGDVFMPPPPLLPGSTNDWQQQTNNTTAAAGGFTGIRQHSSYHPNWSNVDPTQSLPVRVPYNNIPTQQQRRMGYKKQLSEADKDMILRLQRESMQKAKQQREKIVAQLEMLKTTMGSKNEELRQLKRVNSQARVPKDDDLQLTQIIIDTLKMDIKEEEDKRQNWTCANCNYINNYIMQFCDLCNEPRFKSSVSAAPGGHQRPAGHVPLNSNHHHSSTAGAGQYNNYR